MATYYAISTENGLANGWSILAMSSSRAEAERQGLDALPKGFDMRADTWRKNFEVVSESAGKRRRLINNDDIDEFFQRRQDDAR